MLVLNWIRLEQLAHARTLHEERAFSIDASRPNSNLANPLQIYKSTKLPSHFHGQSRRQTQQLLISTSIMDTLQLRDEAVRDRIRAAQEFLDPSTPLSTQCLHLLTAQRRCRNSKLQVGHNFDAPKVPTTTCYQYR